MRTISNDTPQLVPGMRIQTALQVHILLSITGSKPLLKRIAACYGAEHWGRDTDVKRKIWRVVAGSEGSARSVSSVHNKNSDFSFKENHNSNGWKNYLNTPQHPQYDSMEMASNGSTSGFMPYIKDEGRSQTLPATGYPPQMTTKVRNVRSEHAHAHVSPPEVAQ